MRKLRLWVWTGLLTALWVLLAGRIDGQILITAVVAAGCVVALNRKLLVSPADLPGLAWKGLPMWLKYIRLFIWELLTANLQMAHIVLSSQMNLSATVVKFPCRLRTDVGRVVLANTITLTPGTLTLDVSEDAFTVHALTQHAAEAVCQWPLTELLVQLEALSAGQGRPEVA